jgi:hypothetical protein
MAERLAALAAMTMLVACASTGLDPLADAAIVLDATEEPDGAELADAADVADAAIPDAAMATPDAPPAVAMDAPVPEDAPVLVDAPAPDAAAPDAEVFDASPAPDAACRVALLQNADFDMSSGSGEGKDISPWIHIHSSGDRLYIVASADELAAVGASVHSGGYAAHFGGANNVAGGLLQSFTVPSGNRHLALTGQFWVRSSDPATALDDFLRILVTDAEGNLVQEIGRLSEQQVGPGYVSRSFRTEAGYSGRRLSLLLWGTTNASLPTDFFVDSLRLEAVLCD